MTYVRDWDGLSISVRPEILQHVFDQKRAFRNSLLCIGCKRCFECDDASMLLTNINLDVVVRLEADVVRSGRGLCLAHLDWN